MVDGMDFGELCNEFECISSPLVESTARQLARDILELREGNRALGTYAVSVRYKVAIYLITCPKLMASIRSICQDNNHDSLSVCLDESF